MNYLREQYEQKWFNNVMSWLVHNKCDLDGFSGEKCPRCGCAKMRKKEEENPISLFEDIKICNSCAENEKALEHMKLDKNKREDLYCNGIRSSFCGLLFVLF